LVNCIIVRSCMTHQHGQQNKLYQTRTVASTGNFSKGRHEDKFDQTMDGERY